MKRAFGFFVAVVLVAGLSAFATLRWSAKPVQIGKESDGHDWLHRELKLTGEQHKALGPIEAKFASEQARLNDELRLANRLLAQVMAEDKRHTPRVAAAVTAVNRCMGELQRSSIEHVFEMRAVLSPEQGDKLLRLASDALERAP